jgi:hypothetical protein
MGEEFANVLIPEKVFRVDHSGLEVHQVAIPISGTEKVTRMFN